MGRKAAGRGELKVGPGRTGSETQHPLVCLVCVPLVALDPDCGKNSAYLLDYFEHWEGDETGTIAGWDGDKMLSLP